MPLVGVLAFHGDFAEHIVLLASLKVKAVEVRSVEDLKPLTHLIIPGGESTVMGRFLKTTGVGAEIQKRVKKGDLAVYGTCAGAILVASKIIGAHKAEPLELMDIEIERNAYGTQLDSFEASLTVKTLKKPVECSFIRAPIIRNVGKGVEVMASHAKNPVLVRCGKVLAGTFHPEIRGQSSIHRLFLEM